MEVNVKAGFHLSETFGEFVSYWTAFCPFRTQANSQVKCKSSILTILFICVLTLCMLNPEPRVLWQRETKEHTICLLLDLN